MWSLRESFDGSIHKAVHSMWSLVRKWRGLIAVIALFVSLGSLNVLGVPDLRPYDERAHLGYSLSLANGVLPSIESKLPKAIFGRASGVRGHVWVANHPPLFYAIAAPFTKYGLADSGLAGAVTYGRWVSLLLASVGLVFVHAAARLLSRGDHKFALFATLMSASFPSLIQISSLVHNDGLAFLVAAAGLYSAMALVLRGYSTKRVTALVVWACLAMLTRFTSVAVVGAMGMIACGGLLLTVGVPLRQRLTRSCLTGASMCVGIAVTSGWFYARNIRLYGDITGGVVLFEKFNRSPRGSALEHALDLDHWIEIYTDLWTRFGGGVRLEGFISNVAWWLLFAACLGVGVRGYRYVRLGLGPSWVSMRTVCAVGLAAAVLASLAAMFAFYSRGGKLHARYLLPVLWVVAMAMAWGISTFGTKVLRLTTIFLGLLNLIVFNAALGGFAGKSKGGDNVLLVKVLDTAGVDGARWIVGLVLLTIAVSLHVIADEYSKASEAAADDQREPRAASSAPTSETAA